MSLRPRPSRRCACQTKQEFADHPGNCHKCGRTIRIPVSTMNLAHALSELILGHRRHGDNRRRADSIVIFE